MKKEFLLFFSILCSFYACKNGNDSSPITRMDKQKMIVSVEGLRLREHPTVKAKILNGIPENSEVIYLDEQTDYSEKITLRGVSYSEPWYKVSFENKTGWIYGGGIMKNKQQPARSTLSGFPTPKKLYKPNQGLTKFQVYIKDNFNEYSKKKIEHTKAEEAYLVSFESLNTQLKINIIREIYGLGEYARIEILNSSLTEVFAILQKLYPNLNRFSLSDKYKSFKEENNYEGMIFQDEYTFEIVNDNNGGIREIRFKHFSIGPSMSTILIQKKDSKIIVSESYEST